MRKKPLIEPSVPRKKNSLENKNGDLIVYENDRLKSPYTSNVYQFINFIGGGSFGKVYEVTLNGEGSYALKISSDAAISKEQCRHEATLLKWLTKPSTNAPSNLSTLIETFPLKEHIIIVMPLYPKSLLNIMDERGYQAFHLSHVQQVLRQLATAVAFFHHNHIVHTDIKPENFMFSSSVELKLIDYGACVINPLEGAVGYLQSLFYRAPEIILELPYSDKIDIWSMGCVAAEMTLGLPIFAGKDSHNVLQLINIRCGKIPQSMISDSPCADYHFDEDQEIIVNEPIVDQCGFDLDLLSNIIRNFPNFVSDSPIACEIENKQREVLISLLDGMLRVNPDERYSIENVLNHEFLHMEIDTEYPE